VLLRARHIQKATDHQDFVYAFLGRLIARSDDGELLFKAEYKRSLSELRFCLFFFGLSVRSLRFLGLVWHNFRDQIANGPSWCPQLDARLPWAINGRHDASRRLDPTSPNGLRLKLKLYVIDNIDTCGKVAARDRRDSDDAGEPGYHIAELMLTERPSIAERYWSLLEELENCHGTAYQEKEFAFANALLHTMEGDDAPSTACSFADICQEHCPSIQSYLEEHNWLGG
jgi:hypothetical protein